MTTLRTETGLTIERLAGNIGAEIGGVDTGQPLGDEVIDEIRQALLAHRVVFFRDQDLDYERQVAFAQRFGALTLGHPTLPSPESQPFLEEVDSATGSPADRWHTDVTFCDQPPAFTFLHGVVMPDVGGDTMWANTVSAYRSLPQELRGSGRHAAHRAHQLPWPCEAAERACEAVERPFEAVERRCEAAAPRRGRS